MSIATTSPLPTVSPLHNVNAHSRTINSPMRTKGPLSKCSRWLVDAQRAAGRLAGRAFHQSSVDDSREVVDGPQPVNRSRMGRSVESLESVNSNFICSNEHNSHQCYHEICSRAGVESGRNAGRNLSFMVGMLRQNCERNATGESLQLSNRLAHAVSH